MGLFFTKTESNHLKIGFGRQNNPQRPFNYVQTTKYSLLTFIPKALILQFLRAANFVYLISAVLQSIKIISSLKPINAIGPLVFVLFVSLIRQGFEDYKRYSKDKQVNQRVTLKLNKGKFEQINWQDIKAGDIIKVKNTQMIPCDMVILYTTEQNSICYVQTSNLDGETNLKTKQAFTDQIFLYPDQFQQLQGYLSVQRPNSQLYQFNGMIKFKNHPQKSLSFNNLLLRQTHLKNTHEIVGIAVYCGFQSKIMMNQGHIQHKVTKVEKKVNLIQIFLFLSLIGLCVTCSIGYYLKHSSQRTNLFYLKQIGLSNEFQAILIFFSCFLLLNFLIPVSLNVLLQFTKAFLTIFLGFDKKFKDQFCPDGIHVSNMSILQELGIIDYVLTDKTGTLTSNNMVFRSCCIQGKSYSTQILQKNIQQLAQSSSFHNFWICLIICHDVVKDTLTENYQGSSPDQVCFVNYAKKLGYQFIKRTKNYIQLRIKGQKVVYEYLHIIPFTLRKRMSVIVKAINSNNQILMFTKGADSAIFQKSIQYKYQKVFEQNIDEYAKQGLRTLVFSYRKLKEDQFIKIIEDEKNLKLEKFSNTKSSEQIELIQKNNIQKAESNLVILGATAIQDKLQQFVPQTIARLQQAGINIMMITGDKLQTAQNIGYLANLMKKDFKIIRIKSNAQNVSDIIKNNLIEFQSFSRTKIGVIIQGSSIRTFVEQQNPLIIQIYTKFLKKCSSVIFCRSSPQQKALIVKFVKNKLLGTVLAIGDGGNDTGMIQAANVGVGILGRQGNSAAAVSDFYFGQFKHLDRLLLHHGRWFYSRLSYFFVYYGWKNMMMAVIMFLFMLRSAYSGYPAFSQFFISMYNLSIGFYVIGYYGVWAQDINDDFHPDVWNKLPLLYKNSKQTDLFSYKRYIIWTIMGISIAVFLDFFINLTLGEIDTTLSSNGIPISFDGLYLAKSISIIIITFTVIIMDFKSFTFCTIVVALGIFTFGLVVLVYVMQNLTYMGQGYQSLIINAQPKIFIALLVVLGVSVGLKTILNTLQIQFYPSQIDKILKQKYQKGQLSSNYVKNHLKIFINNKNMKLNMNQKDFSSGSQKSSKKYKNKNKQKQFKKQLKKQLKKQQQNLQQNKSSIKHNHKLQQSQSKNNLFHSQNQLKTKQIQPTLNQNNKSQQTFIARNRQQNQF